MTKLCLIYISIFSCLLMIRYERSKKLRNSFSSLREYNENITFRFREKFAHLIRHRRVSSAMAASGKKSSFPGRMCAASHAHASCIVTWHGSPANEPLLLLPFVAVYVFPATSSNTLERPLDYKPLSLSLSFARPPLRPSRSCFSLFSHSPRSSLPPMYARPSSIRNDPYIPTTNVSAK